MNELDAAAEDQHLKASAAPAVLAAILNYRQPEKTLETARMALASGYPQVRVLILDNGSGGDSAERLRELSDPRVEVVVSKTNTGFTGGCNFAFKRARELGIPYVWLLNSDIGFGPETLGLLLEMAESDPLSGLISPLLVSADSERKITYAGAYCDYDGPEIEVTCDVEEGQRWMRERPKQFVVYATAVLVRLEAAMKIGGFDEKFFMYWDDYDLSGRMAAAGYRNLVCPGAVVSHEDKNFGPGLGEIKPHYFYYYYRAYFRLWRKFRGFRRSAKWLWWETRRAARMRSRVSAECSEAIVAGLWHGVLGWHCGPYEPPIYVPWLFRRAMEDVGRRVAASDKAN